MVSSFFPVLATIFIVVDPVSLVPLYIGLTKGLERAEKRRIVRKAILISFAVLLLFVFLGRWILALLHIESGAFFIAGGVMLFIISLEMLFGRPSRSRVSEKDDENGGADHIAVFPLAIPMLAGPGAITAIILFTGSAEENIMIFPMLFLSIVITLAAAWIAMSASDFILKLLGKTGVSVVERIIGLLLSGMSVQFIHDGLSRLGFSG